MSAQALVDEPLEALAIVRDEIAAFVEADASGNIATVVGHMAGGLVGDQVDLDPLLVDVLEEVDHVATVGDRERFHAIGRLQHPPHGLAEILRGSGDPALGMTGFDARRIHLGDDARPTGDLESSRLGSRHTAEPRGNEFTASEVSVLRDTQIEPAGIQKSDTGAVHDSLGADIHPTTRGHLPIVDAAQGSQTVEVLGRVEHTDHQAIGDDRPGRLGARMEEAQWVAGADHQGLILFHDLKVALDQAILHPILADLAGLAVCHELVGIERDIEIEVIVDHHLHGPPFEGQALVSIDGSAPDTTGWAVAIAVDSPHRAKLVDELGCNNRVVLFWDVSERVPHSQNGVAAVEVTAAARCAAHTRVEGLDLRKLLELDGRGLGAHRSFSVAGHSHGDFLLA